MGVWAHSRVALAEVVRRMVGGNVETRSLRLARLESSPHRQRQRRQETMPPSLLAVYIKSDVAHVDFHGGSSIAPHMQVPVELVKAITERRAAIFVGAGLSITAGLPDRRRLLDWT